MMNLQAKLYIEACMPAERERMKIRIKIFIFSYSPSLQGA